VHYNCNCTHYHQIYKTDCGANIHVIELNRTAKSEMKIDIHYHFWVIWISLFVEKKMLCIRGDKKLGLSLQQGLFVLGFSFSSKIPLPSIFEKT